MKKDVFPTAVRLGAGAVLFALAYMPILGSMSGTVAVAQVMQGTTNKFEYDANGNLTKVTGPLNRITDLRYDPLNRVDQQTQPAPAAGEPRPAVTFAYDARDNFIAVADPRGLVTSYTVDGNGDQLKIGSPDAGIIGLTYDSAGNLKTRTDARGKVTTYTYDALNRVAAIGFNSGTGITVEYDGGAAGAIGAARRLTKMMDESGTTSFIYTPFGEVASKTQRILAVSGELSFTVSYAYGSRGSSNGKLVSMTYPSGNRINYDYDAAGRLSRFWLNPVRPDGVGPDDAMVVELLTGINYEPLGPVTAWTWGNSTAQHPNTYTRRFDLDGRVTSFSIGNPSTTGAMRKIQYDNASRIMAFTHISNNPATDPSVLDQTFTYDELDRLTGFHALSAAETYQYDANGNRVMTITGNVQHTSEIASTSNRLMSTIGPGGRKTNRYDSSGNLISDGVITFSYSDRGRLAQATVGPVTVKQLFNGFGQRVYRYSDAKDDASRVFVYDEQGHLIGEYDARTGKVQRETVYLSDLPVGLLVPATTDSVAPELFYVYPDQLGTPRVVQRAADGAVMWRWDSGDPFGTMPPDDNPNGDGKFTFNLRMSGQYHDRDTGLFYNYFRDYDPGSGRYLQSDPSGLYGSLNLYAYVQGNPLIYTDPNGLAPRKLDPNSRECQDHRTKINNYKLDINQRIREIQLNRNGLPYYPPYPGAPARESIQGHEEIVRDLRDQLQDREKGYKEQCGDDEPPGPPPAPAPTPAPTCPENCKKVQKSVMDAVLGIIIIGFVWLCTAS